MGIEENKDPMNTKDEQRDTISDQELARLSAIEQRYLKTGSVLEPGDSSIDDLFRELGQGSYKSKVTASLWGFDHNTIGTYIEQPKDDYGMVFFTRPKLNLSYDNILNDRTFNPMASKNPLSVGRIVKAYLDPPAAILYDLGSPLVDPYTPFIQILSSTCTSVTGWSDMYIKSHQGKPGRYEEVYCAPDGTHKLYQPVTLSATFNNGPGGIVDSIFHWWCSYLGLSRDGTFRPYVGMTLDQRRDYDTRIYSVVLDQTRRYVSKISCIGAGYPLSTPLSNDANFAVDNPSNSQTNTVQTQFQCMGVLYRDGIVAEAFNRIVVDFNPYMHDKYRDKFMIKIPREYKLELNNMGYPRINFDTAEFEWWLLKTDFEMFMRRRNNVHY